MRTIFETCASHSACQKKFMPQVQASQQIHSASTSSQFLALQLANRGLMGREEQIGLKPAIAICMLATHP